MITAELADGRVLEFPDGTAPEVIQRTVKRMLGKPVAAVSDVPVSDVPVIADNPEVAEADPQQNTPEMFRLPKEQFEALGGGVEPLTSTQGLVADVLNETAAGVNRGFQEIIDTLGPDTINALLAKAGSDLKVPALRDSQFVQQATQGGYVEDPLLRQAAATTGEFLAPVGSLTKGLAATKTLRPLFAKSGLFDDAATQATKLGFNEDMIGVVATASGGTKRKMLEQLKIIRTGLTNPNFRVTNRVEDVIGGALLKRLRHVEGVIEKEGGRLEKIADGLAKVKVRKEDVAKDFSAAIGDLGVGFTTDKAGRPILEFKDSVVEALPGVKKTIKSVANLISGREFDGKKLHMLKRQVRELVDYSKTESGLKGKGETAIKDFARSINQRLRDVSPDYAEVNDTLSEAIGVIEDLKSVAGKAIKASDDTAAKSLGTLSRRITSNAVSRAPVEEAFSRLDDVAAKTGGKFSNDLISLQNFGQELDRLFPDKSRTALKHEVSKGFAEAATGDTRSLVTRGFDIAGEKLGKALGRTPEADRKLEALRKLLTVD